MTQYRCECGHSSVVTVWPLRCLCGAVYDSPAKMTEVPAPPPRLGDWAERQLKSIGITQERYKQIKEKFGLPPTCNCGSRKAWLNRVGSYFRSYRPG